MNRTHYIFVDFENIHEVQLDLIENQPVVVVLVLGERHKKLPVDLVKQLLQYPAQVRLVEAGLSGRNALDFVLAYLIGVQSTTDRTGHFHILSRDKGFNALIEHLKKNDIFADRHESFAKIPVLTTGVTKAPVTSPAAKPRQPERTPRKKPTSKTASAAPDRTKAMIAWFAAHALNRPKTKKRLISHLHTHFGKRLSTAELETMVNELIARAAIEITPQGKVIYKV
jgi:hypothetical protein